VYHRELFRLPRQQKFLFRMTAGCGIFHAAGISAELCGSQCAGDSGPTILQETHLSGEQYGIIIACFSYAYMLGNPLWGHLLDRMGVRRGMTAAVGLWTVASAAHAWATGFWSFAVARFFLGAGEGATFPGGLRTVAQTLQPSKRGKGLAVAYSGGSLGAMIAPLIVTPIALWFGWHGVFLATGFFGVLWLLLWRRWVRRWIATLHSAVNDCRGGAARCGLTFCCMAWVRCRSGSYSTIHRFICMRSSDGIRHSWERCCGFRLRRGRPDTSRGARFWIARVRDTAGWCSRQCLSAADVLRRFAGSGALVLAVMWLEMFSCAGLVVLAVSYVSREFPSSQADSLAGLGAGSWGAVVALMMPLFGRMFDHAEYGLAFRIASVFPVVGYVAWNSWARGAR